MKVNFAEIVLKDIEGNEVKANFQKQIGNQLYMQGRNIEECELGKKIYFAEGSIEISEKESEIVKNAVQVYSYIARTAIEGAMK